MIVRRFWGATEKSVMVAGLSVVPVWADLFASFRLPCDTESVDEETSRAARIAAAMRLALTEAVWSPQDGPEAAIATLLELACAVEGVAWCDPDDRDLLTVLESEPLGAVYRFTTEAQKSLNQDYSGRHSSNRTSRAEFVARVALGLSQLHQRQAALAKALDEAFPPDAEVDAAPA